MPQQLSTFLLPILMLVVFYFLLIRPQQKKDKKIREMRNNIKVGDELITIGGIRGKIVKIKDDDVTIEVGSDKVRFEIMRWAIGNAKSSSDETETK